MPEISRFLGIVIQMYFDEHNPPHFHAKYGEHKAQIEIKNFALINGYLPPKVLGLVIEWAELNRDSLLKNWETMQSGGSFVKVTPLV